MRRSSLRELAERSAPHCVRRSGQAVRGVTESRSIRTPRFHSFSRAFPCPLSISTKALPRRSFFKKSAYSSVTTANLSRLRRFPCRDSMSSGHTAGCAYGSWRTLRPISSRWGNWRSMPTRIFPYSTNMPVRCARSIAGSCRKYTANPASSADGRSRPRHARTVACLSTSRRLRPAGSGLRVLRRQSEHAGRFPRKPACLSQPVLCRAR